MQLLQPSLDDPALQMIFPKFLDIHLAELNKYLDALQEKGMIKAVKKPRGLFFRVKE